MASLPTAFNSAEMKITTCSNSNQPCYEFPNGQKSSIEYFSVVEAHEPFCSCKHLHSDLFSVLDENGLPLAYLDDENACGYGCLALEEISCPAPLKQFDYGATAFSNPQLNLPWDTDDAPHFVSDSRFPSLRIGPSVDAPEYLANDAAAGDQDGLDFVLSDASRVVLNQIHNERGKYGTIIVGKWEKLEKVYEFTVLSAVQVSEEEFKTPSIFQEQGVVIPFEKNVQMKEGWLTILYFDAEGANNAGKPNFGFTLDQIKGTVIIPEWDGTSPGLDRIIYGSVREAFDVSRVPGEVEDYLYCDRGPIGFRYYKPNDPQYALDCGEKAAEKPEQDQIICDFSNIKTFVCDTIQQTADPQVSDPNVTTTQDTRPVMTIIEERVSQYSADPNKNTSEARLRMIHDYLKTFLPNL